MLGSTSKSTATVVPEDSPHATNSTCDANAARGPELDFAERSHWYLDLAYSAKPKNNTNVASYLKGLQVIILHICIRTFFDR
jgi:hypothetical protein